MKVSTFSWTTRISHDREQKERMKNRLLVKHAFVTQS